MKEIKQWEDRKKRAVTKGEKKFIEKQIKELKDNLKVCRSKATSFKKGDKVKTKKDLTRSFEIFNSNMKINIIKAYKYLGSKRWRYGTIKQVGYEIYVYLKGKVIRDIIDLGEVLKYLENNTIDINLDGWESKVRRVEREAVKAEKFMKELDELKIDKVAEYEKIENKEINKVKTRKEKLQDEIKIYGDMIEKLRVELEQTISTSNVERIKNTINSHKEQIEEDYMEIAKLDKRDVYSEMTMDEKVSLDEIQNYLRDHNGLLFDDDGYTITDVEVDKYGNIVATTKHQGMVIRLDKIYLDRLHKRMRLVKFMQKEKRSVEMINWKMKEARNWYNSDDFQYAGDGENGRSEYTKKGANEIADEKEQIVKDRLEAELFLVENEIERLKKLREILKHYDYEIGIRNFYYMTTYDDEGEEI